MIGQSLDDVIRLTQMIQPSAVVLDRNWYSTALEARLANCSPDTAIIVCPMPSTRRTTQAYGVVDCLVKPITRQALTNAILALNKPVHTFLVVDDERDVTRMLSRMLHACNQSYIVRRYAVEGRTREG